MTTDYYEVMCGEYLARAGARPAAASDVGIRLRVLAQALGRLEERLEEAAADIFPQTARGEALTLHAQARGLTRRAALPGAGALRFFRTGPGPAVRIPAGTLCAAAGGAMRCETAADAVLPDGALECDVPGTALAPGRAGNAAAGEICVLLSHVAGVAGVRNPLPFAGGEEPEDDEHLRARLLRDLREPPVSANAAYYRAVGEAHPAVRGIALRPRRRGPGTLDVLAALRPGADEAAALAELRALYGSARMLGTDVAVLAPRALAVDIGLQAVSAPDADWNRVRGDCEAALRGYIAALPVGAPLLLARLSGCLLDVDGLENFKLTFPETDIRPGDGETVTAGDVGIGKVAAL